MEHIPEIIVGISYFSCGSWLAYVLYMFNIRLDLHKFAVIWPQIVAIVGAIVCGFILMQLRSMMKRIVFIHLHLMTFGSFFLLISGIVLVKRSYTVAALLGSLGFGFIYVSGLSYLHFRVDSDYRKQRISACQFWLLLGVATPIHFISDKILQNDSSAPIGYFILSGAAINLVLLITNEVFQWKGIYNYKKCLNREMQAEDEKRNNFRSVFINPDNEDQPPGEIRQFFFTMLAILAKTASGFMYNVVFLTVSLNLESYILYVELTYVKHYIALGGLIFGILVIRKGLTWSIFIFLSIISIVSATTLYELNNDYSILFFWIFYFFITAPSFLPDLAIMELSSIKFFEVSLSAGAAFHQAALLASSAFVNTSVVYTSTLWINAALYVAASLGAAVGLISMYPITHKKTALEVQKFVLFEVEQDYYKKTLKRNCWYFIRGCESKT